MTRRNRIGNGPMVPIFVLFLIASMPFLKQRSQLKDILQQLIAESSSMTENDPRSTVHNDKHFVLPQSELVFRFDNAAITHDDSVDDEDGDESLLDIIQENEIDTENKAIPTKVKETAKTLSGQEIFGRMKGAMSKEEIMERVNTAINSRAAQTTSTPAPTEVERSTRNNDEAMMNKAISANTTLQADEGKWSRELWQSISQDSNGIIVPVDGIHNGEIIDGQLVVNVDQTYMFWDDGQMKLCELLQNMTLSENWDAPEFLNPNALKPPLLNVTMNCTDETRREGKGQGNWVTAFYMTRLAAAKARVDFQFQCSDSDVVKMKLLLPWFASRFNAPNISDPWPYTGIIPSQEEACTSKYPRIRIDKLADQISDTVRKMAVTLVGSRDNIRVHPEVPRDQTPLIPGVDLDEVVVHFRCGDVMGGARRGDFGMIKFTEYERWISPEPKSIGILTQPFDPSRNRRLDNRRLHYCRNATYALVDILQSTYPDTKITIHNGPNETLPLAFARLVMANQSFTTLSSFGIFPIIGTFGHGYFQRGNRGVNPFANHLPPIMSNLHMMTAEVLTTGAMWSMNLTSILDWMTSPTNEVVK